jgi:outer membrane protein OmpA-like peptidoglycan-associated protein
VEYLVSQGISKNRLSFKGFGESKPKVPNTTAEGRAKNRRTEFLLLSE